MVERIGAHTHILGLGLNRIQEPLNFSEGMVGQYSARKAAGIINQIVANGLIGGRALLLAGPPGSGKTAIAMGMAKSLGDSIPFSIMAASEIFSQEISKTEAITQAVRKAINVHITEETEIIHGEVVEISITMSKAHQIVKCGRLILKTTEMNAIYDIGAKMIESLMRKKISTGDIITIEKITGKITLMGRSITRESNCEALNGSQKFVQCPEGELQIHREITHKANLHEIDVINSKPQGFLALFSGDTGEISNEVRQQIDMKLTQWHEEGTSNFTLGILFIDEIHLLDIESFSYLSRSLESDLAPTIIFASNRGITTIRGTDYASPHGIPMDLLDRMLIIHTHSFSEKEIKAILEMRSREEDAKLSNYAIELLTKIGRLISLRYAIHLIAISNIIAHMRKSWRIYVNDISKAYGMFFDIKRSAKLLIEQKDQIEFSTI
jgi:RuvB-like protein 2